jgi:serine protease Do
MMPGGSTLSASASRGEAQPWLLPDRLASATAEMVQRVRRSLVVLHNGSHGVGAGILWGQDDHRRALILTNYHVVAHPWRLPFGRSSQSPLRAELESGAEHPAHLLARDAEVDLALLVIDGGEYTVPDLPAAEIADSHSLRVGQLVLAVGHPWGRRGVVTAGLVSSLTTAQTDGRRGRVEVIRSDARLAPGNSGGPLVDAHGAVVGINTLIVGGDQGIAIPSHVASDFVAQALKET